jgi:hypothetical protein
MGQRRSFEVAEALYSNRHLSSLIVSGVYNSQVVLRFSFTLVVKSTNIYNFMRAPLLGIRHSRQT